MDKGILFFLEQTGMLLQMPRTHKRNLGTTFDTVASHSFHVAIMAYCIARMEKLSHEQALKTMTMGLFHDVLEARTGDADFVSKNYTQMDESAAIHDTFRNLPFGDDLKDVITEYEKRETPESRCAKDADTLQQMYLEWVMLWQGNKLAQNWFEGDFEHRVPHLRTESAKKLAYAMKDSNPQEWWWHEFVEKGVNLEHLNGSE